MSFFHSLGRSFSRPFQQTVKSIKQVVTRPSKANFGDFFSTALPFVGGTIVSDIKHPTDIAYQAGTLAVGAVAAPLAVGTYAGLATGTAAGAAATVSSGSLTGGFLASLGSAASGVGGAISAGAASLWSGAGALGHTALAALGGGALLKFLSGGKNGAGDSPGNQGSDSVLNGLGSLGSEFGNALGRIEGFLTGQQAAGQTNAASAAAAAQAAPQEAGLFGNPIVLVLVIGTAVAFLFGGVKLSPKHRAH